MGKMIEPIRIEIPLGIMFQTVNCYIVPGDTLTLIDCGLNAQGNWEIFQKELGEHGYQVSDLEQVIITHEHRDHIGMLPEIMAHSDAVIRAPKMIEGWFSEPDKMMQREVLFNKQIIDSIGFSEEKLTKAYQFFESRPVDRTISEMERIQFFEAGESLQFGNTDWEILHTPGHCLSQHVFHQKEQRRIFGSDMLLPVAPMPIPFRNSEHNKEQKQALPTLLDSYQRLLTLDIQQVYPGHGKEFPHANQTITKQLDRIQVRKEECFDAIKSGLRTASQIREKMYPYQYTPPDFSGLFMVLGYLQLLLLEEKIEEKSGIDGTKSFYVNA